MIMIFCHRFSHVLEPTLHMLSHSSCLCSTDSNDITNWVDKDLAVSDLSGVGRGSAQTGHIFHLTSSHYNINLCLVNQIGGRKLSALRKVRPWLGVFQSESSR